MTVPHSKLLTISVAAYNVERCLPQTLRSICASHRLDDVEVLVVDDGSSDGTAAIAKRCERDHPESVRYVRKENGGHGSTINRGMELASGRFFRVLDGDDWVDTESFDSYLEALATCETDLMLTPYMECRPKGTAKADPYDGLEPGPHGFDGIIDLGLVHMHTLTIRTNLLKRAGVRITEHCFYVDVEFDLWCLLLSNSFTYLDVPVVMYRLGDKEQSVAKANMLKNVGMQERVCISACKAALAFDGIEDFSEVKIRAVRRLLTHAVSATMRTHLLHASVSEARRSNLDFDARLHAECPGVDALVGGDAFLFAVRFGKGVLTAPVRRLYRLYLNRGGGDDR